MPTTCTFELDRLNPIYSSGEYVNGRIILKTEKIKKVNSVYVTLEGEAKVQWSISGKETATYCGRQQYLYSRANVFDNTDFSAGTHVYVLTLHIPPDCPSSIKGPYGYIAYYISVVLDKQRSFDEVFRQPICVIQTLDLNVHPEYSLPVKEENLEYLCHWPCTSGPLYFTLTLPYSGYTPGQRIKYFLELDNQSPHYDILGVEACLKQHYVFLARRPVKRNFYTKSLAKSSIDECTLRLTKRLYEGNLCVPTDTPRSTLNLDYIVFIHYTLQVKLKTGSFHYDKDISAPVVIGTVPLRQFQEEQQILRRNYNRDCNLFSSSMAGGNLITSQPVLRMQRELGNLMDSQQMVGKIIDDEPPSYDSCLPPSFSFALTFGSLKKQFLEVDELKNEENRHINIQLPQFPDYNTFSFHAQAFSQSNDSVLGEDNLHDSYSSIYTDQTGRSLDTLDILNYSNVANEEDNRGQYHYIDYTDRPLDILNCSNVANEEDNRGQYHHIDYTDRPLNTLDILNCSNVANEEDNREQNDDHLENQKCKIDFNNKSEEEAAATIHNKPGNENNVKLSNSYSDSDLEEVNN